MFVVVVVQGDKLHLHRPLTLFRRVRGFACLACLVLTSFVSLTFLAPFAFYLPRFFSVHYGRLWTSFFIGHWLSLWPYLFEEVNETKVSSLKSPKKIMIIFILYFFMENLGCRKCELQPRLRYFILQEHGCCEGDFCR
jgi:hypothetical protein